MRSMPEDGGNRMKELEALVTSSVEKGTFEEEQHKRYPAGTDVPAKLEVITAINAIISKNRHDYILNKHGINIKSYDGHELNALPEGDIVKANMEAGEINEPFYKAWHYVAGIK